MKSLDELKKLRDKAAKKINLRHKEDDFRIVVGMATCGITAGARPIYNGIVDEVNRRDLKNVIVTQVGCIGKCSLEPIVEVYDKAGHRVTYCKVKTNDIKKIIDEHIINNHVVNELLISKFEV